MKNLIILLVILIGSSDYINAQANPASDELRARVPELPITYPGGLVPNPVRIWEPAPAPPLTIDPPTTVDPPETTTAHHDSIRNVYWVHGFGGQRDRWTDARDASQNPAQNREGFTARQLEGFAPTYVENGSLDVAATDVAHAVLAGTGHQIDEIIPFNFLIGHSQGGVVSRKLVTKDHCSDYPTTAKGFYGGLVTFNSSLNGAQILNSRNDGTIEQVTTRVCKVIKDLATAGVVGNIVKFIIKDENGNEKEGGDLCEAFNEDVVPFLFKGLNQPISDDYVVGSAIIDEVNACTAPEISKVAFYGIEPYEMIPGAQFANPIFYRTVQHFMTDVNWSPNWGANDDTEMAIEWSAKAEKRYGNYERLNSYGQTLS